MLPESSLVLPRPDGTFCNPIAQRTSVRIFTVDNEAIEIGAIADFVSMLITTIPLYHIKAGPKYRRNERSYFTASDSINNDLYIGGSVRPEDEREIGLVLEGVRIIHYMLDPIGSANG